MFVLRGHAGSRLIQNDDGGVLRKDAGDGNPPLLASGERGSSLANHRVISIRKGGDEVVVARLFRRCNHLLVYGIRFAKLDIIFNSIVEQVYFLEHRADLRHKRMR